MSRLRINHKSGDEGWANLGPSQGHVAPRTYIGGSLVVAGPVTGPVMGLWGQGSKKSKAEITQARLRFNPDNAPRESAT